MSLDKHYSGDAAWEAYAATWAAQWPECGFKDTLLRAVHSDLLLAQTVYGVVGDSALTWLQEPVPALGRSTPAFCLMTPQGLRAVRECLMRVPYV